MRSVTTVLREIETVGSRTSALPNVESKLSDIDRQVTAIVEPPDDTALLTHRIAERLMEPGNGLLCLGLESATEVYEGRMMD